jgi:hypothetical protein
MPKCSYSFGEGKRLSTAMKIKIVRFVLGHGISKITNLTFCNRHEDGVNQGRQLSDLSAGTVILLGRAILANDIIN